MKDSYSGLMMLSEPHSTDRPELQSGHRHFTELNQQLIQAIT